MSALHFITGINKVYSLTDKLFAMWINTLYGTKDFWRMTSRP
ncbi:hypothetical protein [Porphyromonas gulae]|nr:hypothetical protein [Porphyromonas gulae]